MRGLDDFAALTVALYRARHGVGGDDPLGPPADPADKTHARDRRVAHAAIERSENRRRQREHDDFALGHDSIKRGGYSIEF